MAEDQEGYPQNAQWLSPEDAEEKEHLIGRTSDKWKNKGRIKVEGDFISYFPPSLFGVVDPELDIPHACRLALETSAAVDEIQTKIDSKKIPSPFLWEIIEAAPLNGDKRHRFSSAVVYSLKRFKWGGREEASVQDRWYGVEMSSMMLGKTQARVVEYIAGQVVKGEMTQELLDTARGILKYTHTSLPDPRLEKLRGREKNQGSNPNNPIYHRPIELFRSRGGWRFVDKLSLKGNNLVCENDKLKKGQQRKIAVAVADPDVKSGERLVLTQTAWSIIKKVPSRIRGYVDLHYFSDTSGNPINTFCEPILDKRSRWVVEVNSLSADTETLGRMQSQILEYVRDQVKAGRMDSNVLRTIEGINKYKHGTLETVDLGGGRIVERIRLHEIVKERSETAQKQRSLDLIGKIRAELKDKPETTSVQVEFDYVAKYLRAKQFPFGARIKNLKIYAKDDNQEQGLVTIEGVINVPIPFVGGDIQIRLDLANGSQGNSLVVQSYSADTNSDTLRNKLGELKPQLTNINSLLINDINIQLQGTGKEISGISIGDLGKLVLHLR